MSRLLSQPTAPDDRGRIQCIDPETAGWEYVGFEAFKLKAGASLADVTGDTEVCLVLLAGKADVATATGAIVRIRQAGALCSVSAARRSFSRRRPHRRRTRSLPGAGRRQVSRPPDQPAGLPIRNAGPRHKPPARLQYIVRQCESRAPVGL